MNLTNFFAELKRRNVYKVAVAYVIVSWLLIQAASILFPAFDVPAWAMKVLVVVLFLAFPVALILSWAFEITPEGIKRESEIAPNESITRRTGRRIVGLTIALAAVAAGLLVFQLLRPSLTSISLATAPASPIPEKSIAVLPFDNLSHDPDNAYFSEGIQDEILTRLAKIAELKVISRTSTQRFKSSPEDLRQIAQQLGVANVLEGSVQKAGDQVRVNVQLINATSDAHLWADTYDRKLTDIFAVESEIARTVAETLQAKLTGAAEHVLASRPTEDPEAHQLYLKGRYFWNKRTTANIQKAIEYFQQAIEKDPGYALAYSGLADSYSLVPSYSSTPPSDSVPKALAAARQAVELDDTLAEAHISLAEALVLDFQPLAGMPEFKRALTLNPNYATGHQWYGEALQIEGHFDESLQELSKAEELDPLSLIINASLGSSLRTAGRYDAAIEQLRKAIEMDPTFALPHWFLGNVFEDKGAIPEATAEYERAMQLLPDFTFLSSLGRIYAKAGRPEEARKILEQLNSLSRQRYVSAYAVAAIHMALGEKEEALRFLEQGCNQRGGFTIGDIGGLKIDHEFDSIRGDPRFQRIMARLFPGNLQ